MDTHIELLIGLALIAVAVLVSFFCPEWGIAALMLLKGLIIVVIAGVGVFIVVVSIINIRSGIRRRIRY